MSCTSFLFFYFSDFYACYLFFYCIFVPYLYRDKKGDKVRQINRHIIDNQNISIFQQPSSKLSGNAKSVEKSS